jgi:uncharacterized protein YyaL (SSP411 family)
LYNCDEVVLCVGGSSGWCYEAFEAASAVDFHFLEPPRTVVVGVSSALLEAALSTYRPWHLPVSIAAKEWPYPERSIKAMLQGPKPAAYVCTGMACSMPIRQPEDLKRAVSEFRREVYKL